MKELYGDDYEESEDDTSEDEVFIFKLEVALEAHSDAFSSCRMERYSQKRLMISFTKLFL